MSYNSKKRIYIVTILAWTVTLLAIFPIIWMFLTSFKTELEAISTPPLLKFTPTLENYRVIFDRSGYWSFAWNSVFTSIVASVVSIAIALPAAYSMAFYPSKRTKGLLLWMLSTKMLPAVGVLVPIFLIFRDLNLLDTKLGLIIIFTLTNLPIVVWMLYTFFKDVPKEILEAVRMDGANVFGEIRHALIPLTLGGIAATFFLSVVLCWNESFWTLNLTTSGAAPLPALIASYSSPEGLFWAKLSAVSVMAVMPIIIFGWVTQKQLVRGLTFGAVK